MVAGSADCLKGERKTEESAVLIADNEPAFVVLTHGVPGVLILTRHSVDQFDGEIIGEANAVGRGGGAWRGRSGDN